MKSIMKVKCTSFAPTVIEHSIEKLTVNSEHDLSLITISSFALAEKLGFSKANRTMIATAASELANNIIHHANKGKIIIKHISFEQETGIEIVATDLGPGIADIELAMQDEYSSSGSLGLGLPGSRRLMGEFYFDRQRTKGTKIILRRWL